jgi:hypothetical protein
LLAKSSAEPRQFGQLPALKTESRGKSSSNEKACWRLADWHFDKELHSGIAVLD